MAEKWSGGLLDISSMVHNKWWTTFHELGHNFQLQEWTFLGLQEATCNLWSLYILETVGNLEWSQTHDGEEMGVAKRDERLQWYLDNGRDFSQDWQNGFYAYQGFLPLEPILQLQEAFGWEFLHDMNSEYRGVEVNEIPFTENGKIQEWIIRSSKAVNFRLDGFYEDWGFPIEETTRSAVETLPAWIGNPMDVFDS